ncbi:hypothetical protein [Amnibacterium kyonggiense]|uniref:Uncharacterized protein n=1 Tax=Amnibacterium kyonggiense TaxID=595671 RepID=A0A4R7FQ39_9MICO|nr:hypothetical protein [Amnibacterium kyonggiense]TDS79699.1 hypothetical protein CLV52_0236 [Amnibacterium kyonggiense]
MRDTRLHPESARIALRDVRTPDGTAVRDGLAAARELSAAVARLIPAAAQA